MKKHQVIKRWKKIKAKNKLGWIGLINLPKDVDHKTLTVWKLHEKEDLPMRPYHNVNVHILHLNHDLSVRGQKLQTSSDGLYDDLLLIEWGDHVPLTCESCNKDQPSDNHKINFCCFCGAKIVT